MEIVVIVPDLFEHLLAGGPQLGVSRPLNIAVGEQVLDRLLNKHGYS